MSGLHTLPVSKAYVAAVRSQLIISRCANGKWLDTLSPLFRRVPWLIARCLIQLRKRVAETVAEVSRSPILLLKHGVFDYRSPNRTVFLIASLESAVFLFSEGTTLLATCLLKDGTSIWEGRADFTGEMGLGIWIVFLVRVWEVSAKSGGGRVLIDE
jgi:hypothetical protein